MEQWNSSLDPDLRCQTQTAEGQCKRKAVEGCKNCEAHGGAQQRNYLEKKSLSAYRFAQWQAQVEGFAQDEHVKSLRMEIGILRMLIQERMKLSKDSMELILNSGPLSDLVMKAERLVVSCDKIESKLGNLLDRTKVQMLAGMLLQTVDNFVKTSSLPEKEQETILQGIGEEFLKTLKEL